MKVTTNKLSILESPRTGASESPAAPQTAVHPLMSPPSAQQRNDPTTPPPNPLLSCLFGVLVLAALLAPRFAAASPDTPPQRIPLEVAQREFQARYHYICGQFVQWPKCSCSPMPYYPKDGIYGDFKDNPQLAVMLVQDLVQKFFSNNVPFGPYPGPLYTSFAATPDGVHRADGVTPIDGYSLDLIHPDGDGNYTNYVCADMLLEDSQLNLTNSITTTNYPQKFYALLRTIHKLNCVSGPGPKLANSDGVPDQALECFYGEGQYTTNDPAVACEQAKANVPGNLISGYTYSDSLGVLIRAGQSPSGDNCFAYAEFDKVRGKIYADLRKDLEGRDVPTNNSWAYIYLTLSPGPDEPPYGYPSASHPGPVVEDMCYHPYMAVPLAGQEWLSPLLADDPVTFENGCDYQVYRGWKLYWCKIFMRLQFDTRPDKENCGGCSGFCSLGKAEISTDSGGLHVRVGLGFNSKGQSAGYLTLHEPTGGESLYQPAGLHAILDAEATGYSFYGIPGDFDQILLPQGLVEKEPIDSTSYALNFYAPDPRINYVPFLPPSALFKRLLFQQVNNSTNEMQLSEVVDGNTVIKAHAVYSPALRQWQLTTGQGLRKEIRATTPPGLDRTETFAVYPGQGESANPVYQEVLTYHTFDWGESLVQKVVGLAPNTLTSTWTYGTNAAATDYGRIKEYNGPHGEWERYAYDQNGQETNRHSGWLDAGPTDDEAQCRSRFTTYSDQAPHVTVIDKVQGQETARRYYLYSGNQVQEIVCPRPGAAYTDSDNLLTTTLRNPYDGGPAAGEVARIENPDGTMGFYTNWYVGTNLQTVSSSGQPKADKSGILNGTRTVSVRSPFGQIISTDTWAIENGQDTIHLGSQSGGEPDAFGRFQVITNNLNGTLTSQVYGCCGVTSETDAEGVTTSYDYDGLGRRYLTTRNGISTVNSYDAQGNLLKTTRIGTNSSIDLVRAGYDAAGQRICETNALEGVTFYQETVVNNKLRRTTTNPDAGTRIEDFFRDGRPQRTTGTAASPTKSEYGREQEGGLCREFTLQTCLTSEGLSTPEWTKTYTDGAGRLYKAVYPDGASSQSWYNNRGQLWKERDPDGVTRLTVFNAQGEQEYSIVALNSTTASQSDYGVLSNSLASLQGGIDRVTRSVRTFVVTDSGAPATRIETYVWAENNSSAAKLVARSESSADGLETWQTSWRVAGNDATKAVSHSVTAYDAANHRRTVTVTAPDGTQTVTIYENGQLRSVARKDNTAGHAQVALTSYGYDEHGRQNSATDARNGTTSTLWNDADLVASTTTPLPGNGQAAQTTLTYYDQSLRATNTVQPDNTSILTEYYPTGLRKKTYGSRTYPVQYTYDSQGRLRTMTTWQNYPNTGAATTTWTYNAARGWLESKHYADGRGPSYAYTAAGRLRARTWSRGITATYNNNAAGELMGVAYSDGTPSLSSGYNRRGLQTTNSQGAIVAVRTFDDAGNLLAESYTGGPLNGLSVTNGYDQYSRRTTLAALSSGSPLLQNSFSYDSASRLQTVGNGTASATYSYLDNSPLVGQIVFQQGITTRMTTTRTYDLLNRLQSVSSVPTGSSAVASAYSYNVANQRTALTNADNSYWVYSFDGLGQVVSGKKYWSDHTPVAGQQFEYTFDDIGNRKTAGGGGDSSGGNLRYQNYAANALNQYASRTVPSCVDVSGHANSSATVSLWGSDGSYAPTSRKNEYFAGQLAVNNSTGAVWLTITNVGVLSGGSNPDIVTNSVGNAFVPRTPETFAYDSDGNLVSDGRWTYTWDAENRLVAMTNNANLPSSAKLALNFVYDYQGRRIQKLVLTNNGTAYYPTSTNTFLYDGWNLLATLNPQHSTLNTFLWGLDLSGSLQGAGGVGGLLAVSDLSTINNQPSTHFVAYDGNGNVVGLVNAADGTPSAQYEYGPFGELLRATGPMGKANPFRFSTKYQDDETDLLYYGYRCYSSGVGRWINRDPLCDEAFDRLLAQTHRRRSGNYARAASTLSATNVLNPYAFVLNAPVTTVDHRGLKPCSSCSSTDAAQLAVQLGLEYIEQTRADGRERGGLLCCNECTRTVYAGNIVTASPQNPGILPIIKSKCKQGDKQIADWHTHPNMDTQLGKPGQYSPDWVYTQDHCLKDNCGYHSYMTNVGNETSDLNCNREETMIDTAD